MNSSLIIIPTRPVQLAEVLLHTRALTIGVTIRVRNGSQTAYSEKPTEHSVDIFLKAG